MQAERFQNRRGRSRCVTPGETQRTGVTQRLGGASKPGAALPPFERRVALRARGVLARGTVKRHGHEKQIEFGESGAV